MATGIPDVDGFERPVHTVALFSARIAQLKDSRAASEAVAARRLSEARDAVRQALARMAPGEAADRLLSAIEQAITAASLYHMVATDTVERQGRAQTAFVVSNARSAKRAIGLEHNSEKAIALLTNLEDAVLRARGEIR